MSNEACIWHYMKLSLNQFMQPDFILVCYHLLCRSASYTTGLIKCKTHFQGRTLGEVISKQSVSDVHLAAKQLNRMQRHNEPFQTNSSAASFLKSVTTSCKVLGHSAEAAKDATKLYALGDHFDLKIFSSL